MHEVLLGVHLEVAQTGHDRIIADDVHVVVDDAAGVADELPAHHELVLDVVAEGIAHAAVPAGAADPGAHGLQQARLLLDADPRHRPHRNHQLQSGHELFVRQGIQRVGDGDAMAFVAQQVCDEVGRLLRLVAVPAAPCDECVGHWVLLLHVQVRHRRQALAQRVHGGLRLRQYRAAQQRFLFAFGLREHRLVHDWPKAVDLDLHRRTGGAPHHLAIGQHKLDVLFVRKAAEPAPPSRRQNQGRRAGVDEHPAMHGFALVREVGDFGLRDDASHGRA